MQKEYKMDTGERYLISSVIQRKYIKQAKPEDGCYSIENNEQPNTLIGITRYWSEVV